MFENKFFYLHLAAAGFQAIQAVVVAILLAVLPSGCNWPIYLYNYGCSKQIIFNTTYDMCWMLPCFPAISAISEFGQALWYRKYGAFSSLGGAVHGVRWAEYVVSAGLMLWLIATLSGMAEVVNLVFLQVFNAVLQWCGWYIESEFEKTSAVTKDIKRVMTFAWILHVFIWIPIFIHFAFAVHDAGAPAIVTAIAPALFILFSLFGVNQALWVDGKISKDWCETGYVILSFVSKSVLLWMIFGGARRDL